MAKTLTQRFKLQQWSSQNDLFYYTELNKALKDIDDLAAQDRQGLLSARPAAGVRGLYYFATDNNVLYRDTGTSWVAINDYNGLINKPALLQLGSTSTTAAPGNHSHSWNDISGKPTTFAPSSHVHDYASLTGKPALLQLGTSGTTAARGDHSHNWYEITSKPASFPPSSHTHDYAAITGKPALLQLGNTSTTAAPGNHTHAWTVITGKPTTSTLDGRNIFVGSGTPSASLGSDGDIYVGY